MNELRRLVGEAIQLMPERWEPETISERCIYIHAEGGRGFRIWLSGYGDMEDSRIEIVGIFPEGYEPYGVAKPRRTIAASRGPHVLAKEIERLIPAYIEMWAQAEKRRSNVEWSEREKTSALNRLAEVFGGGVVGEEVLFAFRGAKCEASLGTAYPALGYEVTLKVRGLSIEDAEILARRIAEPPMQARLF